jgi:tRNA(fMet)-specific endonuclease VapC
MRVLIDTNVYSAWKRGEALAVEVFRNASEILVSAVVAGELLFGFHHGKRLQRNWGELMALLERPQVVFLPVTLVTADRFGRIASALRRAGTPIPTNDIWIAAHAFESGAELVSFDAHFAQVAGLTWTRLGAKQNP